MINWLSPNLSVIWIIQYLPTPWSLVYPRRSKEFKYSNGVTKKKEFLSPKHNFIHYIQISYTIYKFQDFSFPSLLEISNLLSLFWFFLPLVWHTISWFKKNLTYIFLSNLNDKVLLHRPRLQKVLTRLMVCSYISHSKPSTPYSGILLPTYILFSTSHLYTSCSSVKSSLFVVFVYIKSPTGNAFPVLPCPYRSF